MTNFFSYKKAQKTCSQCGSINSLVISSEDQEKFLKVNYLFERKNVLIEKILSAETFQQQQINILSKKYEEIVSIYC